MRIGILFVAGFVLALLAYLAAALPGAWFPAARDATFPAAELRLARGPAVRSGDAWTIEPMAPADVVVLSATAKLSSTDYKALAWHVRGLPPATEASVLWQNDVEPGRLPG